MYEMSKRISVCLGNSDYVLSSAKEFAEQIAAAFAASIEGMSHEEAIKILRSLMSHLKKESDSLRAFEMVYVAERADDPKVLEVRDESMALLETYLRQVRVFIRAHAPNRLRSFGLEGSIPRAVIKLRDYSVTAANLLTNDETPIEGLLGVSLNPAALGAKLTPLAQDFSEKMTLTQDESRKLQGALIKRDLAFDRWQLAYQSVSNIFTGFYQIAGEPALARRIRPTSRKSRGKSESGEGAVAGESLEG